MESLMNWGWGSGLFTVGGQEGGGESLGDVEGVGDADGFRGEFREEVVGGEVGQL